MKRNQWIGSTESFSKAVESLQTSYQNKLHEELDNALQGHESVISRLKNAEKTATSMNSKVTKNLGHTDLSGLATQVNNLETSLLSVESCIEDCLGIILDIDECLPPQEKLLASGTLRREHYSLLHESIDNRKSRRSR